MFYKSQTWLAHHIILMSFSRFKEVMNSLQRVSSVCQILLFKNVKVLVFCILHLILFPCALARGDGVMSEKISKWGFAVQKSRTIDQAALRPRIKL